MLASKRQRIGIYLFVVGFLLIGINILINTGIDYGIVIGKNQGFKAYAINFITILFNGEHLRFDIFFNPVGYILIFMSAVLYNKSKRFSQNIKNSAIIGFFAYVLRLMMPFMAGDKNTAIIVSLCVFVEIVTEIIILFSFTSMYTKGVDGFKYLEVVKDFKFGVESYISCRVVAIMIMFFMSIKIPFAGIANYLVYTGTIFSTLYYITKIIKSLKLIDKGIFYEE